MWVHGSVHGCVGVRVHGRVCIVYVCMCVYVYGVCVYMGVYVCAWEWVHVWVHGRV